MKYLKLYENHQSDEEIHRLCKKYEIENYTINPDGSIDVDGNVRLSNKRLDEIPLNFNTVSGYFVCHSNDLTSLKGCPKEVGLNFYCYDNNLTSLEYCPKKIGGGFSCDNNKLKSLEDGPKEVGGSFYCSYNMLTSLKGSPKEVGDDFICNNNNNLKSLEYMPKMVSGEYQAYATKFENLVHILKRNGSYVYYYSTHNKAIHRYGDDTIYLPMFNRMLRGLKLDEVKNVFGFRTIRTKQQGEEYLNNKTNN